MYKKATRVLAGVLLGAAPMGAMAGIASTPSNPGFGEPTYSQEQYDANYGAGRTTGRIEAAGECIGQPANCGCVDGLNPCGISLSSVLTGAKFGETEPNDHIVAADGVITGVLYWGQTPWLQDKVGDWHRDEDWFYITTQEPNELLTIDFTVPDRVLADTSRLSQGWLVSVRDAAGNVYAQFDTRFALDDPTTTNKNESKEITYPIFLGHVGTYYVSVEPRVADTSGNLITNPVGINTNDLSVTFSPYTVAFFLEFSGMDGVPPDVNFHDVEVEPNNDKAHANALTSGVTMYGLLRQTNDEVLADANPDTGTGFLYAQTDVDFFKYTSPGNEQISLAWCGREECRSYCELSEGGFGTSTVECPGDVIVFWFVEVTAPDGTPLISFTTNKSETVHFGLSQPGDYFVEVGFNRSTEAFCSEYSDTEFECKASSQQCQRLTTETVQLDDPNPDPDATNTNTQSAVTCSYESANDCGASAVSTDLSPLCFRTDLGQEPAWDTTAGSTGPTPPGGDYPLWRWAEICEEYGPVCLAYSPITDIGSVSVEYNYTWWGTKLVPLTNGTDAYDAYLERPSWYQDR